MKLNLLIAVASLVSICRRFSMSALRSSTYCISSANKPGPSVALYMSFCVRRRLTSKTARRVLIVGLVQCTARQNDVLLMIMLRISAEPYHQGIKGYPWYHHHSKFHYTVLYRVGYLNRNPILDEVCRFALACICCNPR